MNVLDVLSESTSITVIGPNDRLLIHVSDERWTSEMGQRLADGLVECGIPSDRFTIIIGNVSLAVVRGNGA